MNKVLPFDEKEDYEKLYGRNIDFKGKTVMDVGAERGSTTCFFLEKGAEKVIAVEGNPTFFEELVKNTFGDSRVIAFRNFINSSNNIGDGIRLFKPHIVHMDCESCEQFLLQVSQEILKIPEVYQLEVHWRRELLELLILLFLQIGYRIEIEKIYSDSEACDPWNNISYGFRGDIWMLHAFRQENDWWKVKEK